MLRFIFIQIIILATKKKQLTAKIIYFSWERFWCFWILSVITFSENTEIQNLFSIKLLTMDDWLIDFIFFSTPYESRVNEREDEDVEEERQRVGKSGGDDDILSLKDITKVSRLSLL